MSEIEEALSKQSIFDELPCEINIQQCFDVPNIEINVLCHEQLVMAKTSNLLSQSCEFNLIEVKDNEIKKRFPTYDKVFLHAFILKDDFNSCLPIVESNKVSGVVV